MPIEVKTYKCSKCESVFEDYSQCLNHEMHEHDLDPGMYLASTTNNYKFRKHGNKFYCMHCRKEFNSLEECLTHESLLQCISEETNG